MRIAVGFYVAVGVALIACGCVLQNPPKDYAPAMFVVVGSLNLFASLAGFWGSYHKLRVLMVFILFGGFSVILQIAFDISLFTSEGMGGREAAPATCGSSRVCCACIHTHAGQLRASSRLHSLVRVMPNTDLLRSPPLTGVDMVVDTIAPKGPAGSPQQNTHDKVLGLERKGCIREGVQLTVVWGSSECP